MRDVWKEEGGLPPKPKDAGAQAVDEAVAAFKLSSQGIRASIAQASARVKKPLTDTRVIYLVTELVDGAVVTRQTLTESEANLRLTFKGKILIKSEVVI